MSQCEAQTIADPASRRAATTAIVNNAICRKDGKLAIDVANPYFVARDSYNREKYFDGNHDGAPGDNLICVQVYQKHPYSLSYLP